MIRSVVSEMEPLSWELDTPQEPLLFFFRNFFMGYNEGRRKGFKMKLFIQNEIDTLNEKIRTNEEIIRYCKDCLKSRFSRKDNKRKAKAEIKSREAQVKKYRDELEGCFYLMNAYL